MRSRGLSFFVAIVACFCCGSVRSSPRIESAFHAVLDSRASLDGRVNSLQVLLAGLDGQRRLQHASAEEQRALAMAFHRLQESESISARLTVQHALQMTGNVAVFLGLADLALGDPDESVRNVALQNASIFGYDRAKLERYVVRELKAKTSHSGVSKETAMRIAAKNKWDSALDPLADLLGDERFSHTAAQALSLFDRLPTRIVPRVRLAIENSRMEMARREVVYRVRPELRTAGVADSAQQHAILLRVLEKEIEATREPANGPNVGSGQLGNDRVTSVSDLEKRTPKVETKEPTAGWESGWSIGMGASLALLFVVSVAAWRGFGKRG
jgi:hypothetical protein